MQANQISRIMTRDIISVAPDCLLKDAVAMMRQHNISFLIIAENRKPVGVLSERDIVRLACKHTDPAQLCIRDVMTSPVITVAETINVFQAYDTLSTKKIRHIVVVDASGLITGLATLSNILGGLSIEYFVELKQVTNIMSQNICTLAPDDSVQRALQLMTEKRISCVIISTNQKPVGIITERDITRLYGSGLANDALVESMMSQPVRSIDAATFIPQANAIMREEKLRHLVIVDADGKLSGLISQSDVARRIEEHYVGYLRTLVKQQDQKLQYEHARFAILFEQNPNAVVSCDVDGLIVDINQACMRLSGYSQADMVGKPLESFIHPDDVLPARSSFQQARENETGHGEFRILDKSGRFTDVFNSFLPIYADHSLHRIYSIMHDISDRKQAEQRVQIAEEKAQLLAKAVEAAGDSVMITNQHGTIEFVNAAFTRITGYAADEAIGNNPSMLKSGEQDAQFYAQMWGKISKGERWQSRLVDRRKSGAFFPAELTISPVLNDEGDITHFVGIKRDLTERENLEQQFRQAQKMEAIGTLVGGIAHDFNNMLAGMTCNLYLAKQRVQDKPEVVQKLENIEQLSLGAAEMIRQLLTFSRQGLVSMNKLPLTSFLKETLKLLRSSVPENIDMHLDICSEALLIKGDSTQLHQVLMNLINNARDAVCAVERPTIIISLARFHADAACVERDAGFTVENYARLSVADNGCGMAADQLEHLFEPFFTTKEQGKGTGLGLAMVYGAIEMHDGVIAVDSSEGKGSSFHIYLPLLEQKESAFESAQQAAEKQAVMGSGELILLADDQQHVVETGKEVLETMGYRVLTATDGQQAVELFKAQSNGIDLCILDIVMPVMTGDQAAKQIRQIKPDVKIIFATGYDKNLQSGMAQEIVLSKPFSIIEMSQLIRQQLSG